MSPYAECYSLSSLFLTMVAELKDTMASKYFPPPALLKDKYSTWQKEIAEISWVPTNRNILIQFRRLLYSVMA